MDLFRFVDFRNTGFIDRDAIRTFMREQCFPIDEDGLDSIIRRLDHDGDERLSYSEFVEAMNTVGRAPVEDLPRQPSMGSPLRASSSRMAGSPARESMGSPDRSVASRFDSPSRSSYLSESSRIYQSKSLGPFGEREMIGVFRQQVDLDREIERANNQLALRPDFNLYDLFAMFDPLNKNYVSSYDFERGINNIRVYAGNDEPDLIIRHFSKGGVRLSFAEFCNIFVSKDPEYARIVNNRMREGHRVFSYETEAKL